MTPAAGPPNPQKRWSQARGVGLAQARGSSQGSGDPGWGVAGPTCAKTVLGARDKVGLTIWEILRQRWA